MDPTYQQTNDQIHSAGDRVEVNGKIVFRIRNAFPIAYLHVLCFLDMCLFMILTFYMNNTCVNAHICMNKKIKNKLQFKCV